MYHEATKAARHRSKVPNAGAAGVLTDDGSEIRRSDVNEHKRDTKIAVIAENR